MKCMTTEVFYCKSDMHVRPMRFSILCTPTDISDETQLMYSSILLCLFASKYDIGSSLNYGTAPCPATNLSILICKSFVLYCIVLSFSHQYKTLYIHRYINKRIKVGQGHRKTRRLSCQGVPKNCVKYYNQ